LQNQDLCEIWSIVKDNDHANIWITLADKAIHGVFNEKPVFEGLCEIMVQAAIRKDNNKGKQNFKYNEELTNFLIILGSFSTRALNIFRQNLEGRTIQNIRYDLLILLSIKICANLLKNFLSKIENFVLTMKIHLRILPFHLRMLPNLKG
jgi:hypothetical protein